MADLFMKSSNLSDVDVFMSHLTVSEKEVAVDRTSYYDDSKFKDLRVFDNDTLDGICPLDPVTGLRLDAVTALLRPGLSSLERDKFAAMLQEVPASKRTNLSDDELMAMLPSRYNSTLTDIDKVRDFYKAYVDEMAKTESQGDNSVVESNTVQGASVVDNAGSAVGSAD